MPRVPLHVRVTSSCNDLRDMRNSITEIPEDGGQLHAEWRGTLHMLARRYAGCSGWGNRCTHDPTVTQHQPRNAANKQPTDKRRESTKDIFGCLFYLKHYQRQIAISTANNICSFIHSVEQATHSTFAVILILGLAQLGG